MGSSHSSNPPKASQSDIVVDQKQQNNPWDIDELCDHRLNNTEYEKKLYEAINAYWDELLMQSIADKDEDTNASSQQELHNGLGNNQEDISNKVLFGGLQPGKKLKRKNLEYFTSEAYEDWTWPLFIDQIIEKQTNLPPLYERAVYHLRVKFDKIKSENEDLFKYHDSETLAKNEFHEFLWIFIGFQYYSTNSCEYTLGNDVIIFDFLSKLSLLFKAIMIGYDYEQYAYDKVLNHFMKPCLSNINKQILNRAQMISIRKGLKKCSNDDTRAMRNVYETIICRMEACRSHLSENGIEMKRL